MTTKFVSYCNECRPIHKRKCVLQGDCLGDVPASGDIELLQQRVQSHAQDLSAGSSSCNSPADTGTILTLSCTPSGAGESGDIRMLQQPVQSRAQDWSPGSSSSSSANTGTLPTMTRTPSRARSILGKRTAAAPQSDSQIQETAVGLMKELLAHRKKEESPVLNFAVSLADELHQVKCPRRLLIVKRRLTNIVHEALMDEVPQSSYENSQSASNENCQ